jgi:hypothetical protein
MRIAHKWRRRCGASDVYRLNTNHVGTHHYQRVAALNHHHGSDSDHDHRDAGAYPYRSAVRHGAGLE